MADDFSNLRDMKKTLFENSENGGKIDQTKSSGLRNRVCFIITKKKNSSWVDDLDARDKINKMNRVYH